MRGEQQGLDREKADVGEQHALRDHEQLHHEHQRRHQRDACAANSIEREGSCQ